jgi:ABC-type uncharacterized transport system auxiliary subunit
MKYFIALIFIAFLLIGCSKEEVKLEAFSPESFAFDIGDRWEVNAQVYVKGFDEKEIEDTFYASITYSVDLILPNNKKIEKIFNNTEEVTKEEEITDIPLEVQFELDSTYTDGKYKLLFNIRDNFSEQTTEASVEFDLTE